MHNSEKKFLVFMTTLLERYNLIGAPAITQETLVIASTVYEHKVRLTGTAIHQNIHRGPKMLPDKV